MASKGRWGIAQAAERKWWQRYLRGKDVHTYLTWKMQYWQGVHGKVAPHIELGADAAIADIGCGPAGIFMFYSNTHRVTAVDPLIPMYERDLVHFDPSRYAGVAFVASALESYRPTEQFDIVYCLNAVNHVQDIQACYANLCAMVKPQGYLVMSIDAHNYELLKYIFQRVPGDVLHPQQYNAGEYEGMAIQHNMTFKHSELLKREFIFNYYLQIFQKA
jgi:2-polyprenyl-3-methyl-5-hydroxy-6-metoxy-1,4-benzoquinol methylase